MRPEQVLDVQLAMQAFWKKAGADKFGTSILDLQGITPRGSYDLSVHQYAVLGTAETYMVTKDMGISIEAAAKDLPKSVYCPLTLPLHDRGFVYLQHPLLVSDVHGVTMFIRVITWDRTVPVKVVPASDPSQASLSQHIVLGSYADWTDKDLLSFEEAQRAAVREFVEKAPVLLSFGTIDPKRSVPDDPVMRFMVAFFSMVRQPIVLQDRKRAPRPFIKQWQRRHPNWNLSDVTVVDMRQFLSTPEIRVKDPDHEPTFQWRFRRAVEGHWKRQYYPKLGPARNPDGSFNEDSHRWLRVEEYIRGPEGAPFIETDRVFKVRR